MSVFVCVATLIAAVGCGSPAAVQDEENRCPPLGEFAPTDCAIHEGQAVDMDGNPIPSIYLSADSLHPSFGTLYTTPVIAATDFEGQFRLAVRRNQRLPGQVVTSPDTVTLAIKAYLHARPKTFEAPAAVAWAQMEFFPHPGEVEVTRAVVVFDLPGG